MPTKITIELDDKTQDGWENLEQSASEAFDSVEISAEEAAEAIRQVTEEQKLAAREMDRLASATRDSSIKTANALSQAGVAAAGFGANAVRAFGGSDEGARALADSVTQVTVSIQGVRNAVQVVVQLNTAMKAASAAAAAQATATGGLAAANVGAAAATHGLTAAMLANPLTAGIALASIAAASVALVAFHAHMRRTKAAIDEATGAMSIQEDQARLLSSRLDDLVRSEDRFFEARRARRDFEADWAERQKVQAIREIDNEEALAEKIAETEKARIRQAQIIERLKDRIILGTIEEEKGLARLAVEEDRLFRIRRRHQEALIRQEGLSKQQTEDRKREEQQLADQRKRELEEVAAAREAFESQIEAHSAREEQAARRLRIQQLETTDALQREQRRVTREYERTRDEAESILNAESLAEEGKRRLRVLQSDLNQLKQEELQIEQRKEAIEREREQREKERVAREQSAQQRIQQQFQQQLQQQMGGDPMQVAQQIAAQRVADSGATGKQAFIQQRRMMGQVIREMQAGMIGEGEVVQAQAALMEKLVEREQQAGRMSGIQVQMAQDALQAIAQQGQEQEAVWDAVNQMRSLMQEQARNSRQRAQRGGLFQR